MRVLAMLLCVLLLCGCTAPEDTLPETRAEIAGPTPLPTPPATSAPVPTETIPPDPLEEILKHMTIEERVGQLFLARCNSAAALDDIAAYQFGGFILFREDFEGETPATLRDKLSTYQQAAATPMLIAVDEEGGTVNRISRFPAFRSSPFPSIRTLYNHGGLDAVLTTEAEKCQLLKDLGLNVNMNPVCDISTQPNAFMYSRSLGQPSDITAQVIGEMVTLMNRHQVGSVLKHFPGYGNNADTHTGIAVDSRTLGELESCDLMPFSAGISAGCGSILVSHTIVKALDPELPASLSPAVHQYLREEMGFEGVIMTDDLVMAAITDSYGAGESAVLALLAGNDLLCSTDYSVQYKAVLDAVYEGRISFDMLNAAVRRILAWKMELGLFG